MDVDYAWTHKAFLFAALQLSPTSPLPNPLPPSFPFNTSLCIAAPNPSTACLTIKRHHLILRIRNAIVIALKP